MDHMFRYSIAELPDGAALDVVEMERALLVTLGEANGQCTKSLWSLATLYQMAGHYDQASQCIESVIEQDDRAESLASCYLGLGQIEETRNDFSAAITQYRRAMSLEPCSSNTWYLIHNNLGYSLNQIDDFESAIPYLRHAIQIDANRPNAYKNLGLSYVGLGHPHEAAEMFVTATKANATDSRSLAHLETLIDDHPTITIELPNLEAQLDASRQAVRIASQQQPDVLAHWQDLRKKQQRKWWQFWK